MDMAKERPNFIHTPGLATGFGSYAFHPDFYRNGLLYTTHTEKAKTAPADFAYADSIKVTLQWVLTEWKVGDPAGAAFLVLGRELLRVNVVSPIHGVQEITFNPLARSGSPDYGMLYIGIGDGGASENGFYFLCNDKSRRGVRYYVLIRRVTTAKMVAMEFRPLTPTPGIRMRLPSKKYFVGVFVILIVSAGHPMVKC
jgi:hypothetical protein